jgi:rubrerythrin
MNISSILHEIENTDTEDYQKLSDRRQLLKNLGAKMASAVLPLSLTSFVNHAQNPAVSVVDALNLALELEYFEYAFYRTANNTPGLIPESDIAGFKVIESHEKSHVGYLTKTIASIGGVPFKPNGLSHIADSYYVPSAYDFTRGGVHMVFNDYSTFLMTSQAIEDAGIRAYSVIFESLAGHPVYAQIQRIATAEGRHAAHSRMLRQDMRVPNVPAEWLSNDFGKKDNHLTKANYKGKNQHYHLGLV